MRLDFCKTVARWAYKNTRTQLHADALHFFWLMRLYFCKTVARWAYKNTRTRWHADALPFFGLMRLYFVKQLQDGLTKTHARNQSTESPILFRSYGHEIPFSDQKWASKIGDSVLCTQLHADALPFFGLMRLYFVKQLHDGLTKTHARNDMPMRCTESPILDALFWSENGVSCPRERNKIGDSVLCADALPFRINAFVFL
jgi:hypothetical protein